MNPWRTLRNLAIAGILCFQPLSVLPAQEVTAPFHLWLLNNEARIFATLGNDRRLIERMNMPVPMLPGLPMPSPRVEEKLYKIHLGLFRLFPEFNAIFGLARNYGSGQFARVFERARPGRPALSGIRGLPAWPLQAIAPLLDKQFQESFFAAQGISKERDVDLGQRLASTLESLNDGDRRLLGAYLETFLALYPTNQPTRILAGMVRNGVNKEFAKGLAGMMGETAVISATAQGNATDSGGEPGKGVSGEAGTTPGEAVGTSEPGGTMPVGAIPASGSEQTGPTGGEDPFKILNQ